MACHGQFAHHAAREILPPAREEARLMGLFVHPSLLWLAAVVPVIFYIAIRKKGKPIPFPGISLAKDLPRVKLSGFRRFFCRLPRSA